MARILRKIKNKCLNNQWHYLKSLKEPLDASLVLLEAGQGKNINGNMFAFVREFCTCNTWHDVHVVFVVTPDTKVPAKKRFDAYGFQVELVERSSKRYQEVLARAKYLITDNSFPPYLTKREGQIYLNTWHGTPLKTLGKSDIRNAKSLANIQKNYLMCDYALFPNTFTRDVFMNDYMLKNLYQGNILMCDYPRNEVFMNREFSHQLRRQLKLNHKKLYAYMPTWRGNSRVANVEKQLRLLNRYFQSIDDQLSDDEIFFVNLHFLVEDQLDYTSFKHIRPFPNQYETYDFLSICDVLVTDYSSVFFDFAVSQKPIVLFAYDLADYMEERGTYFPVTDLPFPMVQTVDELMKVLKQETLNPVPASFIDTYCNYRKEDTTHHVVSMLFGKQHSLHLEKAPSQGKDLVLFYGGNLRNPKVNALMHEELSSLVRCHPESQVVLSFTANMNRSTVDFLEGLPEGVEYLALVKKMNFTLFEHALAWLDLRLNLTTEKLNKLYQREKNRLFYKLQPREVVSFHTQPKYIIRILSQFACLKVVHILPDALMGLGVRKRAYQKMQDYIQKKGAEMIDHRQDPLEQIVFDEPQKLYNPLFKVMSLMNIFHNTKDEMRYTSLAVIQTTMFSHFSSYYLSIDGHRMPGKVQPLLRLGRYQYVCVLRVKMKDDFVKQLSIQSPVRLAACDACGYGIEKPIGYKKRLLGRKQYLRGPIKRFELDQTAAYFRQSDANTLYFTVRKINHTDTKKEQLKLAMAYYLSRLLPMPSPVLLFEKESARYEESASVLYEKLIDQGYRHIYFILDQNYDYINQIPENYRKHLLAKGSFKHYLYFFKSRTFFGSESLVHAIDLRVANKYAQRKLASSKNRYVFLQHGVMYMVSLDSESRRFFKPNRTFDTYRVVVSSKEEARHFIELGRYPEEYLYITGLPKFDRTILKPEANKIVIMPTWRPWEYNDARYDFQETNYYQMIERIFNAIPKAYQDQVVILPHPLFYDAASASEFTLKKYMDVHSKYDDILKDTKVLITDYSSIAYDAFYRGSNVIFYWEEKDMCLENYGPSTKLMLDEGNVYGDVCFTPAQLSEVFETNYHQPQNSIYQTRYQALVTYHDGHNTERLIECLKQDHLLPS